ncbi:MAG: hypothetical protein JRG96_16630 [Deltaproteobacteria bacterium]|nr:hypothetical protein [Deltaproteobacteria bacterium]MBW2418589.1 hypothetical protein [Deltaproteobacteria bacterium]
MPLRRSALALSIVSLCAAAVGCSPPTDIVIVEPAGQRVETFGFPLQIQLGEDLDHAGVAVSINGESVLDRLSGTTLLSGVIEPGPPLRDQNILMVSAPVTFLGGGGAEGSESPGWRIRRTFHFEYLPPGKASARRIEEEEELIRGPLAHSKLGDWLLENGEARFVVQDVGQRELYSVGQYGGNIIDAELVGNEGKDNFLELQPGINIETVINAQSAEVVNDGQDGTAAVLRTCGPDDLLDFVNPSSQVNDLGNPNIRFFELADDFDLEVEGCNTFTLEPGDTYVRLDTEIFNNYTEETLPEDVPDPLPLMVGDWINPAGELHSVARPGAPPSNSSPAANGVGPPVTTSFGTIGFVGFDEAAGTDYALTAIPLPPPGPGEPGEGEPLAARVGSMVSISGVLKLVYRQRVLLAMIGFDRIRFEVEMGDSETYTRFFGVGDGSASTAFELENEVNEVATGLLEGCVTVAGSPVAGARVAVGKPLATALPANEKFSDKLASHFTTRTGPCPNFSGTLAVGSYKAAAGLDGHPYESGATVPPTQEVEISADADASLSFDLPAAGTLEVQVTDAGGSGLPARVTVVGFDPSPELVVPGPELPGFGAGDMGLLNDVEDRLPFGIAAVGYADATGAVAFDLEPGEGLYHVFVSRGTEYSAWRTPQAIDVVAAETTSLDAQIARVLETPGFVSSDFHVHGIRSADSRISDLHRVESYSAEGVENVVMTDHHVHTDLRPAIEAHGMTSFVTATVGEEITTFDYGHFNAYPLRLDSDSPTATYHPVSGEQISGGSTDWALAAPAGRDFPSYGAFNATPAEIHALATAGDLSFPGVTTMQINHIGSHFAPLKIDTSLEPPADLMSDEDRANRRLPDTASAGNLFHHFPALELWNGSDAGHQREFLEKRIGIWFNHLNQGLRTTFIADTDSHKFLSLRSAGARTWTASPSDAPDSIDSAEVAASVTAGRAVGGQGVYVQTRLLATDGSEEVAELGWDGVTTVTDSAGNLSLEIHIQSPAWAQWDTVEVYVNAATTTAGSPYDFTATPSLVLSEGDCDPATTADGDFDITLTSQVGGVTGADRWSTTLEVPYANLQEDTWFVVLVRGSEEQCEPMFPMYPGDLATGSNASLADLVDGNRGEDGTMALGVTNALYFEP